MFPYFGSKKRLVKKETYPAPKYNLIIEPFAGSASYSTHYALQNPGKYKIIICDKNPKVISVWKYLLRGNPSKILKLPMLRGRESLNSKRFDRLSKGEKNLISYFINPYNYPSNNVVHPGKFSMWNEKNRRLLYEKIKVARKSQWTIIGGNYTDAPNRKATWFIDPPYISREKERLPPGAMYGRGLNYRALDYAHLAKFCRSRKGQVIVTERNTAKWLPFKKVAGAYGQKRRKQYMEAVWLRGGFRSEREAILSAEHREGKRMVKRRREFNQMLQLLTTTF